MPSPSSPADGSGPSGELDYLTYKLDLIKTLATKAADPHYERASGLRIRELRVLRLLHASPGIVATELRRKLVLDKTLLSKNLSDLEKRGLIQRTTDPNDSRVQRLSLSDEGTRAWLESEHIGRQLEHEMFGELPASDWQRLHELLDDITLSLYHWMERQK